MSFLILCCITMTYSKLSNKEWRKKKEDKKEKLKKGGNKKKDKDNKKYKTKFYLR